MSEFAKFAGVRGGFGVTDVGRKFGAGRARVVK